MFAIAPDGCRHQAIRNLLGIMAAKHWVSGHLVAAKDGLGLQAAALFVKTGFSQTSLNGIGLGWG
ncbi:MAG: hypothetical protein IPN53_15205 [Comamonadaceae bacterium]|nr:hypothetical protein [Comamonadaceae bacterium]